MEIAVVSRDEDVRLAAARAFDSAPPTWTVELHDTPPSDADVVVFGSDLATEAEGRLVFSTESDRSIVDLIEERLTKTGSRLYVVIGAGGGVGVTSIALHLAQAAARNHRACYVDAGLNMSSAARLGIDGEHPTWAELSSDDGSDLRTALPVAGGFRVLLSPQQRDPEGLDRAVRWARAVFERVVVDSPVPEGSEPLFTSADAGVLVVPCSAPGTRRALDLLGNHPLLPWAVVVNRLGPGGELTAAAIQRELGRRVALHLPCTPSLRDAEDDAKLLTSEWSGYVRRVSRLFSALERSQTMKT